VTLRGKERYRARINIPGYYIIGHYHSEIDAAIAYNKAIDTLKRNGAKKNYTPNYIEGLSPSSYADIYSKLKISDKILNYKKTEK
jgi:predicted carbohydrate-binding protein with CBM5 and CBM33 domain